MTPIFFDLEPQDSARDVGGFAAMEAMRVAVACTWDPVVGFRDWWEMQAVDLVKELQRWDRIVGYNITVFDYRILAGYADVKGLYEKSFDILGEIRRQGFWGSPSARSDKAQGVSLNHLAKLNLGEAKAEISMSAAQLYKTGQLEELMAYCRRDVELTQRLYQLWYEQGFLWLSATVSVDFPSWSLE